MNANCLLTILHGIFHNKFVMGIKHMGCEDMNDDIQSYPPIDIGAILGVSLLIAFVVGMYLTKLRFGLL